MKLLLLRWFAYAAVVAALFTYVADARSYLPTGVIRDEDVEYIGGTYHRRMTSRKLPDGGLESTITDIVNNKPGGKVTVIQPAGLRRENSIRRLTDHIAHLLHIPIRERNPAPVVVARRPLLSGDNWHVTLFYSPGRNLWTITEGKRPSGASVTTNGFVSAFERQDIVGFESVYSGDTTHQEAYPTP